VADILSGNVFTAALAENYFTGNNGLAVVLLIPSLLARESRPFFVEPRAFVCAIGGLLFSGLQRRKC
jgi:hypothetical protein